MLLCRNGTSLQKMLIKIAPPFSQRFYGTKGRTEQEEGGAVFKLKLFCCNEAPLRLSLFPTIS